MKKWMVGLLIVGMLLALTACGAVKTEPTPSRQIAAARLDQDGNDINVTVDLSGGWSVEFAAGAIYLYDKAYEENLEAAAIGMTLDREVFEEYWAEAEASASRRELNGARYYKADDGKDTYLIPVGDDAWLMLKVEKGDDSDAVFARVKAERGMNQAPAAAWTREGYYEDGDGHILSITRMDDVDEPGWYVGCMLGTELTDDSWGGMLPQVDAALQGALPSSGSREALTVTVTEEGEDGLLLAVEGGESYHFTPMELPEATIIVNINTEGWGMIAYAEGEETPEIDPEWPYQSAYIGLAEPETYTFAAAPEAGSVFVKWTKNGEDYATEPVITLLLDESADYVAVFEEDPDWQNPVMNFIGEYQCDRAHALVECFGKDEAWITIEWGGSATELARWIIVGRLDTETMTVEYSGCAKTIVTFDESGEELSQETEYEDGTGTVVFHDDGTFTWHEDQSEYGTDMVFEWVPVAESAE